MWIPSFSIGRQEYVVFLMAVIMLNLIYVIFCERNQGAWNYLWHECVILVLGVYLAGVCYFTILHRDVTVGMQYELSLFWSYRLVRDSASIPFFWEIIYNIVLLVPLGILVPLFLKYFEKFRYVFALGLLVSTSIECCQLYFHIGLFEFDDIFNNTLGACMGYSMYYLGHCLFGDDESRWKWLRLLLLWLLDGAVVWYFWNLWGQIH